MTTAPGIDAGALGRALIDGVPDMLAVVSKDGKIAIVNRAWERFGRQGGSPKLAGAGVGEDFLGKVEGDLGDDVPLLQRVREGIRDVLDGAREQFEVEYSCDLADQKRWFRLKVLPIPGMPHFRALIHRDISEYERLRKVLREQEALGRSRGSEAPPAGLAPRQRQVLELVTKGFSNKEIAFTMGITTKTVDYHIRTLKAKLGRRRRAELVRAGIAGP